MDLVGWLTHCGLVVDSLGWWSTLLRDKCGGIQLDLIVDIRGRHSGVGGHGGGHGALAGKDG